MFCCCLTNTILKLNTTMLIKKGKFNQHTQVKALWEKKKKGWLRKLCVTSRNFEPRPWLSSFFESSYPHQTIKTTHVTDRGLLDKTQLQVLSSGKFSSIEEYKIFNEFTTKVIPRWLWLRRFSLFLYSCLWLSWLGGQNGCLTPRQGSTFIRNEFLTCLNDSRTRYQRGGGRGNLIRGSFGYSKTVWKYLLFYITTYLQP